MRWRLRSDCNATTFRVSGRYQTDIRRVLSVHICLLRRGREKRLKNRTRRGRDSRRFRCPAGNRSGTHGKLRVPLVDRVHRVINRDVHVGEING
jgi:hypothetical protein